MLIVDSYDILHDSYSFNWTIYLSFKFSLIKKDRTVFERFINIMHSK